MVLGMRRYPLKSGRFLTFGTTNIRRDSAKQHRRDAKYALKNYNLKIKRDALRTLESKSRQSSRGEEFTWFNEEPEVEIPLKGTSGQDLIMSKSESPRLSDQKKYVHLLKSLIPSDFSNSMDLSHLF